MSEPRSDWQIIAQQGYANQDVNHLDYRVKLFAAARTPID